MMEDADASNLATIEVLMELLVNLVRGEYDGMPGCFSAFPVTVILGVSGVSASDGGVMDLVRQMDEVLLVDEILLLDSTAVFEGFMDVIEIQMPALGFPLIASKQTVAILRDMFMNSRMCNEDVMRAICFIVRDYFDCNPWSVLCDPLVVTRAAGDAKKLSSAFASRLAGLSKMAREALAVHLKKEGCRGYTKADGCLDEAKASKHLGTLLGQRSKVAALALFWDALARTTAKKHTDKSARLEPYLFPEDEVGLRNDIERMCIAVEKLSGMSTVTFKSCVERTASLEKSSRILPPECLDGHHGTELGDIIMFLKSLQNKVAPHGSAFPQASTVLTKHVSDLVTFIRQTLGAAVISTDLLPLRAAACEWDKSGELSDACLNVLDVDVFFDALGEADAIVDGEDRERSISEVPRDSSGKLPPGYSEKLSDLTIVYRQYLQHARTIDLEDLWTSFCEKVKDVEDPAPSSEDMKVRFGMCLCTLEFLGVIQPPSRGSLMKGQDPSRFFKGLRVKKLYFVDPQNSTKKAATEDVIMEDGEGENEGDDRGTKPNASSKKRAASAKKATPRSTAKRGRASRILYL
ncbi:hypothetical protein Pmar_PMAR018076 [Perkinsus marinus ATCC 50983]|uniref:Uncharacterized protein n=1 Tax=Perkinsus marinus (strain ATCC 50983 / TXsc) TaxID=423536 RepID=C5KRY0_PERM5|nr:hypothetical protein Pmar_PMAR018076 [Perkinsus marinus ATCC 50983]EER12821.1 hypothetical protein Pmar_PMAR018076 [Perkinsus marinus ATCC 50983]|eukprot:XP_002781026.1 hypothetical protein Pmar_PMAR018076 [Perkinsus marinus ATCC 50983]